MSRSRLNLLLAPLFLASVAGVCLLVGTCDREPPTATTSSAPPSASSALPAASKPPPSAPPPGGTPVLTSSLLEGLHAGDTIGDWTVTRMLVNQSVQKKPQLAVELERRGSGITIWVARKDDAVNPPLTTAKYALSFGDARPYGETIPDGASEKVMQLLGDRVKRTEATADPPPGL